MKRMDKNVEKGLVIGIAGTLAVMALGLAAFTGTTVLAGIQAAGSVAIAFSAITAYRLYQSSLSRQEKEDRRAESEAFLEEAVRVLNRAYDTFTRFGEDPPRNDRLLWLSAARMILRYQDMRERITEVDHQAIADENEEYVRFKFYSLLDACKDQFDVQYFLPNGKTYDGESVARNSVAVVFDFAKWREGMEDPLEKVDDIELFARGAVPIDFFGVENYLGHYQEYWEEIQRRKAAYRGGGAVGT
jgi:hypothetical protein